MTSRPFERAAAPWLILLISALVIFTLMPNNRSSILVKELAYALGGAACSLLLASAVIRRVPLNPSVDWKLASAFVLLLVWMVFRHFSGVPSVNGPNTIISFGMLGLVAGSAGLLLDARGRKTVLAGMMVLVGLLCIYSLLQWMNLVIFPWDVYLGSGGRVSGSLGNPNLLGGFLSACIPVAAGFLLEPAAGHRTRRLILLGLFSLASVLCIVASGTRGSIIGLGAGLVFMAVFSFVRSRGGFRGNLVLPLICMASLLLVGFLMKDRLVELTRLGEGTARVRLVIWEGAARLIAANPFLGYGPGTFQIIFPAVRNPMYSILGTSHNTLHVHCEYLEILVEVGLIGAILYAAIAWRVFRSASSDGAGGRRRFGMVEAGILGGIVALLAEAFVSVSLRWPPGAFLLAILCGLLLSCGGGTPRPAPGILGAVLIAPALFMAFRGTDHYVTGIRSGNYLFLGKDLYLDKIENELVLASNAAMAYAQTGNETRRVEALQRFESAWLHSDSSIAICTRCVEINPEELGGWYGLGSAWLTRAVLIEPTNQALSNLLRSESRPGVGDHELALQATRQALAAYESLRVRAPDYAELNNNLALTYTRLGQPDMAMHAIRRAYELHGHRRPDYISQALSLSPIGGQFDALHILWHEQMNNVAQGIKSGDKIEERLATAEWISGLAILFNPGASDSLAEALSGMAADLPGGYSDILCADLADQAALASIDAGLFQRAMECDTTGLLEAAAPGLASTDAILPGHLSARAVTLGLRGDLQGYEQILQLADQIRYCGFEWASSWPSNGGIPAPMIEALPRTGPPASWRGVFLRMVLHLLNVDSFMVNRVFISRTDFSESVPAEVLDGLVRVWRGVGGLRSSSDQDPSRAEPWIPGSVMAGAAALAGLPDTSGSGMLETGIAFHLLSIGSTWWGTTQPTVLQRDYMIQRLDALRDSLDSVLGAEEARYSVNRLLREIEPILNTPFRGVPNPFMDVLEDKLIEGTTLSVL
ncbi:MAG TPA: O-antigen ligase family protein [Candidatus Fermentibacter daniensis]|jgi:O-antigen ligase/tetratricopeptide (TPR) repeat protein|nr:MAG: hypothetical protein AO396_04750 [Candidatus Fermentibacter daniensis]MBP7719788.1 O-antigen ligase family protein [Candidatus Fermentibacter sp.]OQC69985.1 MAG: O-Antigen ligase [candidate division Hyd24-12 bacterium ADurb.Bin004]KZD17603.1 MAG: hypothetical protein AO394_05245 [Candidatus Fermentibacter daniensis]KZD19225.1 MAG: hypothetical protein AO395_08070 [Candidatus Fermentibacter daniensis]